jgi:hypothetical protein
MDQRSKLKASNWKLIWETLDDIGIRNYFLNRTPVAHGISARIDK